MLIAKKDLAAAAKAAMEKHKVPGLTACVIENAQITQSIALGVKDPSGTPMTRDTIFESASLTKPFFAVHFMRLVDRGIVTLDDTVLSQGAPVWSEDPRFAQITPRHCLSHSTGFPNWAEHPLTMAFDPGKGYCYSGEGFFLIQRMVEKKLDMSWTEAARKEFFEPWGLDAEVCYNDKIGPRISYGFAKDGSVITHRTAVDGDHFAPEPNAAWSLYSNAETYAKFLIHLMTDHAGLSDASFQEMMTPQNHVLEGVDRGISWGMAGGCLWHTGANSGYKNVGLWDPADNNGITIFTNSDNGSPCYQDILLDMCPCAAVQGIVAYCRS